MQPDATKIRKLLKKTQHFDKDERYMATSDLTNELEKVDGLLDSSLQTPIRDAILKQLDDANNDVQAQAIRCLVAIVQKFNAEQVEEIVDKLGIKLVESSMELRDIYCDALKKIIREAKEEYGGQISRKLVIRIMDGLKRKAVSHSHMSNKQNTEEEHQQSLRNHLNRLIACLDILTDLLSRFGHIMADAHQKIVSAVLPMLNSEKAEIRKKVAIVLGALVGVLSNDEFQKLMNIVITRITESSNASQDDDKLFTYIQTIGVFSRNAGKRISEYLNKIVPLLIGICNDSKLDEDPSEAHKELRENCLQAFETLIIECPKEMSTHSKELKDVSLQLMKYDPNWDYPDSDNEEEAASGVDNNSNNKNNNNNNSNNKGQDDEKDILMQDSTGNNGGDNEFGDDEFGDDEFGDGGDGDEWGDGDGDGNGDGNGDDGWGDEDEAVVVATDDDTSWKVRRAAVKMLAALVQTHKGHVQQFHLEICKALLSRFKEHDISVKEAIFLTFRELLMASIVGGVRSLNANVNPFEAPPLVRQISAFELMSLELGSMVKHIVRVFNEKNVALQTKKGLLGIIGDLVVVRQAERSERCAPMNEEGLSKYFDSLIPQIVACAKDKDVQLKIQSLAVLSLLLQKHRSQECLTVLPMIENVVIECVMVDYARVKTQALLIISRMMEIVRPFENNDLSYNKDFESLVNKLFSVALKQLELKDVEQDVKKAALDAAAKSIAHFGDILESRVASTLDIFIQRLSNEVTRQTSLVCFGIIAESKLKVDLSKCGNKLVSEMSSFLKQHSNSLKLDTAATLRSVIRSTGKSIDSKLIEDLIIQCSDFINDSDLHLCHLILDLLCEIMKCDSKSCKMVSKSVFPQCYRFLQSPLLQGSALMSLKSLFVVFRQVSNNKYISYEAMKSELIKSAVPKLSRQSYGAISQCLASVTLECDDSTQNKAVTELIAVIQSKSDNEAQIALLCIGEIGKKRDLSSHSDIEKKIFSGFSRESEPVRWAASNALGNMAVGNMSKYVPSLLNMIKSNNDRQYLLLNSLKEIITAHSDSEQSMEELIPYSESIVPLMLENASSKDEGVRAMIAECLGKFAVIDKRIFEDIEKLLTDKQKSIRSTMAAAVKFSLSRKNNYLIPESTVKEFLQLLKDSDLTVKRQAFLTVNTILHVNNNLIVHALHTILPIVYNATIFDAKLVREVDLGPFKHREDDGLPLRKASFQCLDTLLESVPHSLDLFEFLKYLTNGITDESPDIQMLSYQILARLAHLHGSKISGAFDELPGPLMNGIKAKLQEAKQSNQDAERAKDILRAAVKALYAMKSVPNVANRARSFVQFYGRVEKTKILIPMIADLKKTSKNTVY